MKNHNHPASLSKQLLALMGTLAIATAAQAQTTLYWGGGTTTPASSVNTTGATTSALTGTWDLATTNWNTDPAATTGWQTWTTNSIVAFKSLQGNSTGSTANVTLAQDVDVAGFNTSFATSSGNQNFRLLGSSSSTDRVVTLGANAVIEISAPSNANALTFANAGAVAGQGAAILAGTNGFTLNGRNVAGTPSNLGVMNIQSTSTLSGPVNINSGQLRLGATTGTITGSLQNVANFYVNSAGSVLQATNNGTLDNLSNTATVHLRGGQFGLKSTGNAVSASETVGSIVLDGSGWISMDPRDSQTATVQSTLNLANGFSRGGNGTGVLAAFNGSNADGGLGTATGIEITGHGFAANQSLIPFAIVQGRYKDLAGTDTGAANTTRFMATDGSGNLRGASSVAGATDLTTWDTAYSATSDIHFDATTAAIGLTGALDANAAIRSLAIGTNTNNTTGNLFLGGNTLRADAIAVAGNTSVSLVLGSADASRGTITANGTSGGDLYLIHQRINAGSAGTFTVNSVIGDNGGAVNVIFGGATANFSVAQATSNTGKVYINAGGGYGSGTVPNGGVTLTAAANFNSASEINFGGGGLMVMTTANQTIGGSTAQTLSGGANLGTMGNIYAATRNLIIGANGTFAPGNTGSNSTFSLQFTTGKLEFVSGATVSFDLGSTSNSDSIAFIGATAGDWLTGTGLATLDVTTGSGFQYGVAYTVFNNVTTDNFTFADIKLNGNTLTGSDYSWVDAGTYYTISFVAAAVPEPAAFGLFAGLAALGYMGVRRPRRTA